MCVCVYILYIIPRFPPRSQLHEYFCRFRAVKRDNSVLMVSKPTVILTTISQLTVYGSYKRFTLYVCTHCNFIMLYLNGFILRRLGIENSSTTINKSRVHNKLHNYGTLTTIHLSAEFQRLITTIFTAIILQQLYLTITSLTMVRAKSRTQRCPEISVVSML